MQIHPDHPSIRPGHDRQAQGAAECGTGQPTNRGGESEPAGEDAEKIGGETKDIMRIYISGQITGLDYDVAVANFEAAENHLAALGYEPVNPMKSEGEVPGKTWAEYLAEDIILIDDHCDAIYMLPNWRNSDGAQLEHFAACLRKKAVFYAATKL